jgi:hypothetical protein
MEPERFEELFTGITRHIDANYSADFTADVKGDYLLMVEGDQR